LIGPSIAEIWRVLARLLIPAANDVGHVLAWSRFRRVHQTRALLSHYRNRRHAIPTIYECSTCAISVMQPSRHRT
jgi:hypothetical protein